MCNALMFTNKIKKNIKNKKNGALCVLFNVFYLFILYRVQRLTFTGRS